MKRSSLVEAAPAEDSPAVRGAATSAADGRESLVRLAGQGESALASSLRRVLPVDGSARVTVSAFNSFI